MIDLDHEARSLWQARDLGTLDLLSAQHDRRTPWTTMFGAPDEFRWQDLAACAGTDPEAFFPEQSGAAAYAQRVCAHCDVRAECLEYALANREHGYWGGMSEHARLRLLRRRQQEAAA
jgi:WhiB family redox-sensing transcriptional regulator